MIYFNNDVCIWQTPMEMVHERMDGMMILYKNNPVCDGVLSPTIRYHHVSDVPMVHTTINISVVRRSLNEGGINGWALNCSIE